MKNIEKNQKFSDRYFQDSHGPWEQPRSRIIIFFLNEKVVLHTIDLYHLEGPESQKWASTALWFARDSQKCEKSENMGKNGFFANWHIFKGQIALLSYWGI